MTPGERRASLSLAGIFALRMLGLFLVLPVFALEARDYRGGDDPAQVGLAMGIYGLTQALLQIPFGLASDRWGRKPVILAGLLVFIAGSLLAAVATDLNGLLLGRALQGAGAISAAVTALLADQTRDLVRTKAMALVGISIALMFVLSLMLAPPLAAAIGLRGLFLLVALLGLAALALLLWLVPPEPARRMDAERAGLRAVLTDANLLRLNLGVFVLHAVQLAMWMALPALLVKAGLIKAAHWQVYLPTVVGSLLVLGGVFRLERKGYLRAVLRGAVVLLLLVQLGLLWLAPGTPQLSLLGVLLWLFFVAFNVLEASQPSLASRLAPTGSRGAALGVFNTAQSLGLFCGGAAGGYLVRAFGAQGLFVGCAAAVLLWLLLAWPMQVPALVQPP